MLDLPDETLVQILAALSYVDVTGIIRVCRSWRALRSAEPFRAAREAVDEASSS